MARRGRAGGPDGLAVVDKATDWTSHDVVAKARGLLGTRRVGHSGTLDPDATGLLLLGVGRATRLMRFLGDLPKSYECDVVLGVETSTLDAAGEVTVTHDMDPPDPAAVEAAAAGLTGPIMQVPPMVSAIRVDGKRLHELAREGVEVEREARPVTVHRFGVTPTDDPMVWRAEVQCSSGTYVRVLAADLGVALGGGAHLRGLCRTAIGSFTVAEAVPVEDLDPERLLAPASALRDHPSVVVDADLLAAVRHGKVLPYEAVAPTTFPGTPLDVEDPAWAVLDPDGTLVAVYERHKGDTAKPAMVVAPAV